MEAKLTTIRSEIEKHLSRSGYNLASFAKVSGLNRGSLSAILHGNPPKPISLGQLDAMTRAFGFPEGWLYPLYVEECFGEDRVSRRRVEPFLVRCAEIGKQKCIDEVLSRIMEYPRPLEIIYTVAERLFCSGRIQESLTFYRRVVQYEPDSYSERMAISQFRIFMSLQTTHEMEPEQKLRGVISFEPYRGLLPEDMQLDGLLKLARVSSDLQHWRDAAKFADELRALAGGIYREELRRSSVKRPEAFAAERPLVMYYGQSYLLKATALMMQGDYEQAKQYTAGYADLGWFELLDEDGRRAVEDFRQLAAGSSFKLEILMGNTAVLPSYISFLADHPGEILPGMVIIMESANRFGFCADAVMARFSREMLRFEQFQDRVNVDRLYRLYYQIAIYHIGQGRHARGIDYIMHCLRLTVRLNSGQDFINCVTLFEQSRDYSTEDQQKAYRELLKEVRALDEPAVPAHSRFGIV
ncbi:DNA-binding protein [Paenibacillus sp. MMS20-IR301]|uniref:DNA-binding protein n=1 Tax=Paenibacillus sp. MMS20-IR301 TaxID=2895946 RepID=UPI0028E837D6|nr:DNA-binding protein [Paenibacillus sp. MMS20-IR301]WNS42558.1 DNA-binding protein [Paenibacillus sp. MMS20-IR301]